MGIRNRSTNWLTSFLIFIFIDSVMLQCDISTQAGIKNFTVNTWTNPWTFVGFEVGATSGDFYHLLTSDTDNQCAIIRETSSGTQVWAKLYPTDQCCCLSIDGSESKAYFSNVDQTYTGIGQVDCSTGQMDNYFTNTDRNKEDGVSVLKVSSSGDIVYIAGSIFNYGAHEACHWNTSSTILECATFAVVSPSEVPINIHSNPSEWMFGMTKATDSTFLGFSLWNTTSTSMSNTALDPLWAISFTCSLSCAAIANAKSDNDAANIHTLIDFDSGANVIYSVVSISAGAAVVEFRQTTASDMLRVGSLYVDTNSIAWIGLYSTSSDYSELIMFDASSNSYTKYEQTGYKYSSQYVNPSSSNSWYALALTEYGYLSQISNMNLTSGLTVTNSSSGFDLNSSIYTVDRSITGQQYFAVQNPLVTTVTNTESAFDYSNSFECFGENTTVQQTTNSGDDDDLSTGEIVGIVIGCVVGLIIIVAIVLISIIIYRVKKRRQGSGKTQAKVEPVNQTNYNRVVTDAVQPEQL